MKILSVFIALLISSSAFAANSEIKTESVNKSITTNSKYALKTNPQIHFSTNMLGNFRHNKEVSVCIWFSVK